MNDFAINGCRAVLSDGVLEDACVRVEEGRIAEVLQGRSIDGGMDARGAWLLPGFVDVHSDAIEKAVEPRPNARFPTEIAVRELDRTLVACGVTTMYHSLSFADLEFGLRSNNVAAGLIEEICGLAPRLRARTRVHARFEITDLGAAPHLERLIEEGYVHLFSFMDHSPGQGQYRDEAAFRSYYGKVYRMSDEQLDAVLRRKERAHLEGVGEGVAAMAALCRRAGIPMASHDDDSVARLDWCQEQGIAISEFPIDIATAKLARERGLPTCLGAPNLVRGSSQGGNLSVREALAAGCGDILCSDYLPLAILHAVFLASDLGLRTLPESVAMATLSPARAVGIGGDTGSIETGKAADLLLVERRHGHPDVLRTWVEGREVYATC
jgi:alpha-D-ribose 1-methylphosphonate 5-triphosphate diphosphatase